MAQTPASVALADAPPGALAGTSVHEVTPVSATVEVTFSHV
ncbi:hypothetical protein [Nocardia cyriacigeorgica]|nr:hypothetical protein [Nocardia cyriacigeorgica]